MRKVNEIARLSAQGLSNRQISKSCQVARSTVAEYLTRISAAGLSWPFPPEMSQEDLDARIFQKTEIRGRDKDRSLPVCGYLHKELRGKGMTLMLLWEEYLEEHSDGYCYSQFCNIYRRWNKGVDACMRQTYYAGEKMFVDYAGMTMPLTDPVSGEISNAEVFVATLGASNYIYAEATLTQKLHDWLSSHVRTFEYFGGVTQILVPDNLKSGVTKPCRYDPDINKSYADMAAFYDIAVIPARVRKPKDKAKVETSVQIIERKVLAALRDYTFFSLGDMNKAIWKHLEQLNKRPFQKLDGSRLELFEELDKPALKPLPSRRYEFAEFYNPKVNIDYHIDILGHYYSVPHELIGQRVDVRLTARMVEVLHKCKRIASHVRDDHKGRHTTNVSHMPKAHQEHLAWTPSRIIKWAGETGPYCKQTAEKIIASKTHPQQGYRSCLGLIRLSKDYETHRVEDACQRALALDVCTYKSIKSILKTGKDKEPISELNVVQTGCAANHQNVRGKDYYANQQWTDFSDVITKEVVMD